MRHWGRSVFAICLAALAAPAFAGDIVSPNDQATVEGNTAGNFLPNDGVGLQVLLDVSSSQFSALSSGDVITGLAFRPDVNLCGGNPCGVFGPTTLDNVTIKLATTSISPTTNDLTFGDYLTTNLQTVFSGDVTVSSAYTGPAGGPTAFDILFPFASSYAYNPADGNLVVDIIINSPTGIPVDIDAVASPTIQSEYFGGASSTAGLGNSNVDIVEFTTASSIVSGVPEPATWALMLLGVGAIGAAMRRRSATITAPA